MLTAWLSGAILTVVLGVAPGTGSGIVHGIVFDGDVGGPLAGVAVRVEGEGGSESVSTNADGVFRVSVVAGTYTLVLDAPGLARGVVDGVSVLAGEETEVLLTLHADIAPTARIEAPGEPVVAPTEAAEAVQTAPVSGRLLGPDGPVGGARVFARGQAVEATSGPDGRFQISLPLGEHELTVLHPGHVTTRLGPVTIGEDAAPVDLGPQRLEEADRARQVFRVTAPRIAGSAVATIAEQRASTAVSDGLGAEQMSRAGDSDAAAALKRVTGVTIVGGRFVYVRGMGERYSQTLLDRSTLPSPEPEKRVVPLDIMPVDLLEGIVIQKAYTPDLPGEFGGGSVQLRTRGLPEAFELELSASLGARVGTTFEDHLRSEGGPFDMLGIDGGFRALPPSVADASSKSQLLERDRFSDRGYTQEELIELGRAMPNRWDTHRETIPPDVGFSARVGDRLTLAGRPFGYAVWAGYDSSWAHKIDRRFLVLNRGSADDLSRKVDYDFDELERRINLAGLLTLGYDLTDEHRLRNTTMVTRITDDTTRIAEGFNADPDTVIRLTRLRWVEQMLLFQQVRGEHEIPDADLDVDWRYAYSRATRDEPDRRDTRYDLEEASGRFLVSDRPEAGQRVFSELVDNNHDAGLDVAVDALDWLTAKLGGAVVLKDREVDTRRFKYLESGTDISDDLRALPPEQLYAEENIAPGLYSFTEVTQPTDNYTGTQKIYAGYLSGELGFMPDEDGDATLSMTLGARIEHSDMEVGTFVPFDPDATPLPAGETRTDVLPAFNATWRFVDDMDLRVAFSRTLNRPDFREKSPAFFSEVTGGRLFQGNPDVESARINHADLRWAWYPTPEETISVGAFGKVFEKPIEVVVIASAQESETVANAAEATNIGIEFDVQKKLGFVAHWLEDVLFAFNAAWIQSRVDFSNAEGAVVSTNTDRALQGQSPWAVNASLFYERIGDDEDALTTRVGLLYNAFGPRISSAGANSLPDELEETFHTLDLVARQELGDGYELSFKARNLVDAPVEFTQGGETTDSWRKGRSFSLGVSKAF